MLKFNSKRLFLLPVFVFFLGLLVFAFYRFRFLFRKPAGLIVNANLPAQVILDSKLLGTTPYTSEKLKPGKYRLELKPQDDSNLPSYQAQIILSPRLTTTVYYNFAKDVASSSGYILQYEPNSDTSKTTLAVISDPDICSLSLDDKPHGFTPLKPIPVNPGEHLLSLTSPGFQPLELKVQALASHNLLLKVKLSQASFQLNPTLESSTSATPSASLQPSSTSDASPSAEISRPYVVIQPTGTGWLRVRNKPNTTDSEEIGKVDVGEKLKFLKATDNGWYKVIFEGQEGWISGRYAKLYK